MYCTVYEKCNDIREPANPPQYVTWNKEQQSSNTVVQYTQ